MEVGYLQLNVKENEGIQSALPLSKDTSKIQVVSF